MCTYLDLTNQLEGVKREVAVSMSLMINEAVALRRQLHTEHRTLVCTCVPCHTVNDYVMQCDQ